ncbi:retrovirus-related pol polyprotein from transposon TNT 1-94 [Tanacetum coccineum]
MITQPTDVPLGSNTEVSRSIIEPLVPDVTQSHITNQASTSMLTRSMAAKLTAASASECLFADFLSEIEPKKISKALKHPGWIDAMQEELNQFYKNNVRTLVPLPYGKIAIGSKWVFMNKKYEHDTTTKNKARLVAQGYSQEDGTDYDETFAPVARMEAIIIFLAFATYMNFKVYQMGVKSAFLNGKLKEEVYVKQPPGFESSEFPDYVYKLDKTLYGLIQAPRAWSNAPTTESSSQVLVAQDGLGGYDWSNDFEVEPVNYALMAESLSSSHQVLLTMRLKQMMQILKSLSQSVSRLCLKSLRLTGYVSLFELESDDEEGRGNPEILLQDHAVVDSGCSSHMTGNKAYLLDYEDFNGGFVAFGSDPKGGKIPIDASTLPNVDLPIDQNMPDLEDASDTLPNDGIFNGVM